jgi:hemerythrin-like domain-containing protein
MAIAGGVMVDEPTGDVVAALLDAHARGREILQTGLNLLREGGDEETVARVAAALFHFVTFVSPLHEFNEEELVFPALRAYGPNDVVTAALTYVVGDHIDFDALREKLALRWGHVVEAPAELSPLRVDLLTLTEQFAHALDRHAEHEELVIFPLVRRHVPPETQAKMLVVMAQREK